MPTVQLNFQQPGIGSILGQEFQVRLDALLATGLPIAELLAEIERLFLEGFQPVLEEELHRAIFRAWVGGAADVLELPKFPTVQQSMFPPIEPPDFQMLLFPDDEGPGISLTAIEKAATSLLQRQVMSAGDFYAVSATARQEAFTITADLTTGAIEDIREVLVETIQGGASLDSFADRLQERVGTLPISEAHLEQVFRNNVNEAYSQGHDEILSHPMVRDAYPYRLYTAIHDYRVRRGRAEDNHEDHLGLERIGIDGTAVYHKDDPTWRRFRPPWSWGCRCGWIALDIETAARYGVREAQEWLKTGIEPSHPPVPVPAFSPPPSWDRLAVAA